MRMSGQFDALSALPQCKVPLVPIGQALGGPRIRSGRGGEESSLCRCWKSIPGLLARNLLIVLT
jgi:hypothetical protein